MDIMYIKIIESAIIVFLYFILRVVIFKLIKKTLSKKLLQESRGAIIKNYINIILTIVSVIIISLIWGVKQSDLVVFVSSVLTVVGVAFVAQWSLLSNITSGIIIFFNHPLKINDNIVIMEGKDYEIEGTVSKIGLFFITLKTKESGEITLPNNVFILKSIKNLSQGDANES